jgi:hypothetical protein
MLCGEVWRSPRAECSNSLKGKLLRPQVEMGLSLQPAVSKARPKDHSGLPRRPRQELIQSADGVGMY